jgi:hypothetical protein
MTTAIAMLHGSGREVARTVAATPEPRTQAGAMIMTDHNRGFTHPDAQK